MRPERPITDYNTRFSGITAAMMAGVRTTLAEARARLAALVPAEALLVGHALQNDLVALRLAHGRILDTALLYPHPKVRLPICIRTDSSGSGEGRRCVCAVLHTCGTSNVLRCCTATMFARTALHARSGCLGYLGRSGCVLCHPQEAPGPN